MVNLQQTIEKDLLTLFKKNLANLLTNNTAINDFRLTYPKDDFFGDYTTNLPFLLASALHLPPKKIAELLITDISANISFIQSASVAKNGFLNFTMTDEFWQTYLLELLTEDLIYITDKIKPSIQIEFVSANPTGPLNVVNARAAALGDSIARLFHRCQYHVEKEFYINDAGKQTLLLSKSLQIRIKQLLGEKIEFPEWGYPGDYLIDISKKLIAETPSPKTLLEKDDEFFKKVAINQIRSTQEVDLQNFGVVYDNWFSEKNLYEQLEIQSTLDDLKKTGFTYQNEEALWLKTSSFGDEKDRVLIKSNGDITYFLSDIAYHRNKKKRGFDILINIWGPDHHGHIQRMKAAFKILGYNPDNLEVIIGQQVNLLRGSKRIKMTKRGGTFILMRDIVNEVGKDAARFFFLIRRPDSHLDFDLDLAVKETKDNPVFYIQYACARIASIFRKAKDKNYSIPKIEHNNLKFLKEELERKLIKHLTKYNDVIEDCLYHREPHKLAFYLIELANIYHKYQHDHRILTDDESLRNSRLLLLQATLKVISDALNILGISVPERM